MATAGLRCFRQAFSSCSKWGYSLLWCADLSLQASLAAEHSLSSCGAWLSCSEACGIFPNQGSNPRPLQGTGKWILNQKALKQEIHAPFSPHNIMVNSLDTGSEDLNSDPAAYQTCDFVQVAYFLVLPFPQPPNMKNLSTILRRLSWGWNWLIFGKH